MKLTLTSDTHNTLRINVRLALGSDFTESAVDAELKARHQKKISTAEPQDTETLLKELLADIRSGQWPVRHWLKPNQKSEISNQQSEIN